MKKEKGVERGPAFSLRGGWDGRDVPRDGRVEKKLGDRPEPGTEICPGGLEAVWQGKKGGGGIQGGKGRKSARNRKRQVLAAFETSSKDKSCSPWASQIRMAFPRGGKKFGGQKFLGVVGPKQGVQDLRQGEARVGHQKLEKKNAIQGPERKKRGARKKKGGDEVNVFQGRSLKQTQETGNIPKF